MIFAENRRARTGNSNEFFNRVLVRSSRASINMLPGDPAHF